VHCISGYSEHLFEQYFKFTNCTLEKLGQSNMLGEVFSISCYKEFSSGDKLIDSKTLQSTFK